MEHDDDSTTEPPDNNTETDSSGDTILAELEGELTEAQLAFLTAEPSLATRDDVDFSEYVYMSEAIPSEQFTSLCGFYVSLLSNDIDIEAIRATPETIHLDYQDDATTPDERGDTVEQVAGSYIAMFTDDSVSSWVGGPLPTLDAVGADPDAAISWRLEWSWAEQYVVDDVSGEELLDRIRSTIEVI